MRFRFLLRYFLRRCIHAVAVLCAAAVLAPVLLPFSAQAQPEPMVRVAVQADSAYVYHTKRLPPGHGFNIYREQDGGDSARLNDTPVRGIQRASRLPVVLGARYDWLAQRYDADSPSGVYLTMRSDWTNGLFAAFLDPVIARALGLLFVDAAAPVGEDVTYRIAFVDDHGEETGEDLTRTVTLAPTPAPTPDDLAAENEGRRVTLSWRYPTSSREADDKIVRFDVYRVVGDDRAERVNGGDVILRNAAAEDFLYRFTVPRTGRTETFFVAAVDVTGRAVELSERLPYHVPDNQAPSPIERVDVYEGRSGEAQLTWPVHSAPDVAGYHVYRATHLDAAFDRITDARLDLLETSFVDTTVVGRRAYHYRVTAIDSAGNESEMSDAALAQVADHEPPPSPSALEAVFEPDGEGGAVHLRWRVARVPPDLRTFQVLRRRSAGGTPGTAYAQLNAEPVRGTAFEDMGGGREGGFAEGAFYRYAVVAMDSARNVSDTAFARIQVPNRTPPDPPTQVQAFNDDGLRIAVTWNAATALDAASYRVYRGAGEGPDTLWKEVPRSVKHLSDDDVQPGRRYRYTVSTVDSVGNEGARSDPAAIEMRDLDAPAAVRNVQAQVQGEQGVRVRWEPVSASDVAGYRVYRTPEIPTGIYEPVQDETISGTVHVDATGQAGAWYQVRAVDTSGNESRASQPARAEPLSQ